MQPAVEKIAVARKLQAAINAMQGLGKSSGGLAQSHLAPFDDAFPGHVFPTAAIHEFVSYEPAHAAATNGFITALTGKIIKEGGICLWIGSENKIFPSGLKAFGLEPDRVVFITAQKIKDQLWIIEEALKCESLSVIVGEIKELSFSNSRRLQLAVEHSGVTGFIHRFCPRSEHAVACTTRWKITPVASRIDGLLPGIGQSCWDVQLLKVKNGRPDAWEVSWSQGNFIATTAAAYQSFVIPSLPKRHAG